MSKLKLGKYKHYKGKYYEVIGLGRNSKTLEEVVCYKALYNSEKFGMNAWWVRPKKLFVEMVCIDGKEIPRFEYIK